MVSSGPMPAAENDPGLVVVASIFRSHKSANKGDLGDYKQTLEVRFDKYPCAK